MILAAQVCVDWSVSLVEQVNEALFAADLNTNTKWPDVNECLNNNGGCDSKRACINTEGGRICGDCSTGYIDDGDKGCKGEC